MTKATCERGSRCVDHTDGPGSYVAWGEWAEEKSRTHDQKRCEECGLWAIWVPKNSSALDPTRRGASSNIDSEVKTFPQGPK